MTYTAESGRAAGRKGGRAKPKNQAPTNVKIARTKANADLICALMIDGLTLPQIAKRWGATGAAILMWKLQDQEFAEQYHEARLIQADAMADEAISIADDAQNDWMEREGVRRVDYEAVNRSKLRVETRMRLMASYAPRRFGAKVEVEHALNDTFASALAAARERRMAALDPPTIEGEAACIPDAKSPAR